MPSEKKTLSYNVYGARKRDCFRDTPSKVVSLAFHGLVYLVNEPLTTLAPETQHTVVPYPTNSHLGKNPSFVVSLRQISEFIRGVGKEHHLNQTFMTLGSRCYPNIQTPKLKIRYVWTPNICRSNTVHLRRCDWMSRVTFQEKKRPNKNTTTIDVRVLNHPGFGSKFLARFLQGLQALPKLWGGQRHLWRRQKTTGF